MGSPTQEQHALLTDYDMTSAYAQAFYTLFANIRFHWENEPNPPAQQQPTTPPVHTLLITSASIYKDQATVATNLAIVAAQSGAETILVDANLRSPGIRQRFGLTASAGLGDLLGKGILPRKRLRPVCSRLLYRACACSKRVPSNHRGQPCCSRRTWKP